MSGIAAGLHALVGLPEAGPTEAEIVARAADHGLAVEGLGAFAFASTPPDQPHQPRPQSLVIGYGTPPDHAYTATVARLTAVLSP